MEVKPGYKQTEVGLIPEDWEVAPVGLAFDICNNLRMPISQTVREKMAGTFPYYGPTSIQGYINEYRVEGEYALIGEDGDHFLKWQDQPMTQLVAGRFNVNNHAHLIKGTKNLTAWFYHYFSRRDLTPYLTRQGAGRFKLTKQTLIEIPCALPPTKAEQEAIAEALSDADALIESLEQLLAKKRQLKQGAMQELLTGKKRLPGFSGEWDEMEIGGLCHVEEGEITGGGNTNYLEIGDIDIRSKTYGISGKEKLSVPGSVKVPAGTLLISKVRPTRGAITITRETTYVSSAFCRLSIENSFMFYLVCQDRFLTYLGENSKGGTYPTCRTDDILRYRCSAPRVPAEQTAIAAILSAMGAEIAALEGKIAKARQLRQGMMQELLTGRIRLV